MNTKQVAINDATDAQLREFAVNTLGLDIHHSAKAGSIVPKIRAIHDQDFITVADSAEEEVVSSNANPSPEQGTSVPPVAAPKTVRLIIQREDKAGGDAPVPVGVNGRIMLIPRGKPVDVPVAYARVLGKAIQHIFDPAPGGGINPVPREVPLYPHQIIAA